MFQFRAFPSYAYLIQRTIRRYCLRGFPHSEISGSTDICSSPKLIAACHVLRRLLMPRHSPCALYSLTLRDILVLLLELCRQSTGYFRKIVIVTHIFSDVPQLKFTTFLQLSLKPSVALLSSHFNTLFSFQGAITPALKPDLKIQSLGSWDPTAKLELVGPSGLEPPTLRLSVVRSSQLSYGPIFQSTQYVPSKLNNARKKRSDLGMLHKAYGLVRSP